MIHMECIWLLAFPIKHLMLFLPSIILSTLVKISTLIREKFQIRMSVLDGMRISDKMMAPVKKLVPIDMFPNGMPIPVKMQIPDGIPILIKSMPVPENTESKIICTPF